MYIPPPCQTRSVLAFGQFREGSSAGGVGRRFVERAAYFLRFHWRYAEAGIDHQRSVQGNFIRRGRRKKVQGRFKNRAHTGCKSHQGRYDVEVGIDHQKSVPGSFFLRGRRKKVPGRFQAQAPTRPSCEVIKGGENRSSEVSSGKFHPPGASEESARNVPKASTYIGL